MSDDQIKHMVDRFLAWRLPDDFRPDAGISFERDFNVNTPHPMKHQPTGTNLFDATQAEAMVRYLVEEWPYRRAEVQMNDEAGWLIERGNGSELEYLGFRGYLTLPRYEGRFDWLNGHESAIRFAREHDALAFLAGMRALAQDLPYRLTMPGLRPDEAQPRVADHRWCVGPAPDNNETLTTSSPDTSRGETDG